MSRGPRAAACALAALVALIAGIVLVAGTGAPPGSATDRPDASDGPHRTASGVSREVSARAALASLVTAWADGDRARFVDSAADTAPAAARAAATWRGLTRLDVQRWNLRYVRAAVPAPGSLADSTAVVEATWSQRGWQAPATARVTVDLAQPRTAGEGAGVLAVRGAPGSPMPLWALHSRSVHMENGRAVVVLPGGASEQRVGSLARQVTRARAQVNAVVPGSGTSGRPLVVVAPRSTAQFARVLGQSPDTYAGIAAVTTTVDGSSRATAPVHVVLNPDVFAGLSPVAAQVVLTHEVTHAMTNAAAGGLPLWVAEGFADHVALRDSGVPARLAASQALAPTRRHGPPRTLPSPEAFAVGSPGLGRAYEQAWLVFRLLDHRYGEKVPVAFYRAVLGGRPVDEALRATTGAGLGDLIARWRAQLTRLARADG
ncbi:MAG: hypothetical protein K0Q93_3230 [Nocardioidaceae bacterium]|nr:hypothetical protein [Nocardioidaceae bacterium]